MADDLDRQPEIPWSAPAALGFARRDDNAVMPEIAGLTLADAIERAMDLDEQTRGRLCIWVNWAGREVVLGDRQIRDLAARPDRPTTHLIIGKTPTATAKENTNGAPF